MPEIARDEAVQKLVREFADMQPDDLAEVYNELFPVQRTTESQARLNRARLMDRITAHVNQGLEDQEILDLWHVVFPRNRHVAYDDETNTLHYEEASQSV